MNDINALIEAARAKGATVLVSYDDEALRQEGRNIIETVTVIGLRGVGPQMPAVLARHGVDQPAEHAAQRLQYRQRQEGDEPGYENKHMGTDTVYKQAIFA